MQAKSPPGVSKVVMTTFSRRRSGHQRNMAVDGSAAVVGAVVAVARKAGELADVSDRPCTPEWQEVVGGHANPVAEHLVVSLLSSSCLRFLLLGRTRPQLKAAPFTQEYGDAFQRCVGFERRAALDLCTGPCFAPGAPHGQIDAA